MFRKLVALPVVLSLASCASEATLKQASSSAVPCPSEEIEIRSVATDRGINVTSWEISCQNHVYRCAPDANGTTSCEEVRLSHGASRWESTQATGDKLLTPTAM
jgi:hypothetical protein